MAFMGIFLLMIIFAIIIIVTAVLIVVYIATFIYALLGAIISGIVWLVKKRKGKRRELPLTFLISYGLMLSVLIGIGTVEAGKTALLYSVSELENQPAEELGVYIEETEEKINETETITFNGVEYHRFESDTYSFSLNCHDVSNKRFTPLANIPECTKDFVYYLENDAGVTMLTYDEIIYLTDEDSEKAIEYYCNTTEPHHIYLTNIAEFKKARIKMDDELFNQLYSELRSKPREMVKDTGPTTQFYVKAMSNDKIAKREILMTYSPSKGEIYFDISHNDIQIQSREARDIIYPLVVKHIPPPPII